MENLEFPIFNDDSAADKPVSVDEFLKFVIFVNRDCNTAASTKEYEERKLPATPFVLDRATDLPTLKK